MSNVDPNNFVLLQRDEELAVIAWLKSRPVQKLVKRGADFAIVFSRKSGIGVTVTGTVKLGEEVLSKDITNYSSW